MPLAAHAIAHFSRTHPPFSLPAFRVLRLKPGAPLELCDGRGGLAPAVLAHGSGGRADTTLAGAVARTPWAGPSFVVAAACGGLKGGRGDWLVEKMVELGARGLAPVLTERSPRIGKYVSTADPSAPLPPASGDDSRWLRVARAATKQSLRTHELEFHPPGDVAALAGALAGSPVALVAAAGGMPVAAALASAGPQLEAAEGSGAPCYLIVGPEGDFAPGELEALRSAGAVAVGLGPSRLRVETAALALLAAAVLRR